MAHAYFVSGELEEGIGAALAFAKNELELETQGNPDVVVLRHGLFSVEDARRLQTLAELAPTKNDRKAIIVSASRIFHEAQNAVLKLFEEPPAGTTLILVIPSAGLLLPTLRSRLLELALETGTESVVRERVQAFLADPEKTIAKLLDRAKSDKDEEKQSARLEAVQLVEGLTEIAHSKWVEEKTDTKKLELQAFLKDLNAFLPILHERSAPLKLIFEHILLVLPAGL